MIWRYARNAAFGAFVYWVATLYVQFDLQLYKQWSQLSNKETILVAQTDPVTEALVVFA